MSGDTLDPEGGERKKATIYDLAEATGFSSGTVSRVLNNRSNVAPRTRDRILQAARDLNLKPKLSVRTRQVAIISDLANQNSAEGYTVTLTSRLAYALSKRGIATVFPSDPEEELPKLFLDGVIALNCETDFSDFLTEFEHRTPVIYMDKFDTTESQYCVCSDHYQSGYLAADYLAKRGKRRLSFFAQDLLPHRERMRGFCDALKAHDLPEDAYRLVLDDHATRLSAITRNVRSGVDSIYIPGSSYQVVECLHLLTYVMGVRIPEDLSVIGGENEGLSELMSPPLTTIKEPLNEMAEEAVAILDKLMEGDDLKERKRVLPVSLIERNSVAGI